MARRHEHDYEWQLVRGALAITGAILFVVAGRKLHVEGSPLGDGLGMLAYGLAVVCLLVGLPARLEDGPEPSEDQPTRPT